MLPAVVGLNWVESLVAAAVASAAEFQPDIKARWLKGRYIAHGLFVHLKTGVARTPEATGRDANGRTSGTLGVAATANSENVVQRKIEDAIGAVHVHHLVGGGKRIVHAAAGIIVFNLNVGLQATQAQHGVKEGLFACFKGIAQAKLPKTSIVAASGSGPAEALCAQRTACAADYNVVEECKTRTTCGNEIAAQAAVAIGLQQIVDGAQVVIGHAKIEEAEAAIITRRLCLNQAATEHEAQ